MLFGSRVFRACVNLVSIIDVVFAAMLSRLFCQPSALGEAKTAIGVERATSCKPKRTRDVSRHVERCIKKQRVGKAKERTPTAAEKRSNDDKFVGSVHETTACHRKRHSECPKDAEKCIRCRFAANIHAWKKRQCRGWPRSHRIKAVLGALVVTCALGTEARRFKRTTRGVGVARFVRAPSRVMISVVRARPLTSISG